jgi:hypothetical protein
MGRARRHRGPGLFDTARPDEDQTPPRVDPLAELRKESKAWLALVDEHVPRRPGEDVYDHLTRQGTEWARRFPDLAEEQYRDARRMKPPGFYRKRAPKDQDAA